jgi:hypothetical protein
MYRGVPSRSTRLRAALLPALLATFAFPLFAGEPVPDLETALARARAFLAASHPGDAREIVAARYIPPHGNSTVEGFWQIDFGPYPADKPLPAKTLTGVLISFAGSLRERGERRAIDPAETEATRQHAEKLGEMMRAAKERKAPPSPAP